VLDQCQHDSEALSYLRLQGGMYLQVADQHSIHKPSRAFKPCADARGLGVCRSLII
jgi:hypothetical protein